MHGYPIAVAAVFGSAGLCLWAYKKLPRGTAWCILLANVAVITGVTIWLDVLAGYTATGTGLTVLLCLTVLTGIGFAFEGIRKHKYHRIRTPVVSAVFGQALVLTAGNAGRLLAQASHSPGKSAVAFGAAVSRVQSGAAAHAIPAHQRLPVLAMGIVAALFLVLLARKFEGKGGGSGLPSRPALGGGRARAALPAGRRR